MKALRFKPLIKPTIWGGEHILELKGITEGPKQSPECDSWRARWLVSVPSFKLWI